MALIIVIGVIAMASIIGYAMLSSSALQAQIRHNANSADTASYLAESAVQAALHYLQYPSRTPAEWKKKSGYYIFASNQTLGSDISGRFDLEVQPTPTRDEYTIRAVGYASNSSSGRTITARVKVDRAQISGSGHFGSSVNIPVGVTITGKVESEGTVTNLSLTSFLTVTNGPLPPDKFIVPSATTINYYGADRPDGRYLTPDGKVGYAQKLSAVPTSPPVASSSNPGRVFYLLMDSSTNAEFKGPVTIDGTLVVKGGGMSIQTSNVVINPRAGYPALIVERDLIMYRTNVTLRAEGTVWIGRNIVWDKLLGSLNTGSRLTINGALLMPSNSPIGEPGTGGELVVSYDAAKAKVPDLSTAPQPGTSVKIVSWNE